VTIPVAGLNGELTTATNANGNSTGKLTSANFSGAKDQNQEACTVTAEHLPWHAELTSTETAGKSNGNGKLTLSSGGNGGPQVSVVCGQFLNCAFGVESTSVDIIGSSTAPTMKTTGLAMTRISGFFCPSSANLDAEYTIAKPASLFAI
jgi:hypothetical protein